MWDLKIGMIFGAFREVDDDNSDPTGVEIATMGGKRVLEELDDEHLPEEICGHDDDHHHNWEDCGDDEGDGMEPQAAENLCTLSTPDKRKRSAVGTSIYKPTPGSNHLNYISGRLLPLLAYWNVRPRWAGSVFTLFLYGTCCTMMRGQN